MSRSLRTVAALGTALLPIAAQAHTGHDAHATLMMGLLHPLTGWDHLVVLLSLGVLAAGRGARMGTAGGVLLALALGGGAALGLAWPAAYLEPAILATVLACTALLYLRHRIGSGVLLALSMAFAFIHGIAHGQEAPAGDLPGYFAGFTLAGVVLYGIGQLAGRALLQKGAPITSRQPGKSPASR